MLVKDLIELLEHMPSNNLVMATDSRLTGTASVDDVFMGGRTHEGFCFIQLQADSWVNKIDELKFQRNNAENEASKNRGETTRFIEIRTLSSLDGHAPVKCIKCGKLYSSRELPQMRFCKWCGRKIEGVR